MKFRKIISAILAGVVAVTAFSIPAHAFYTLSDPDILQPILEKTNIPVLDNGESKTVSLNKSPTQKDWDWEWYWSIPVGRNGDVTVNISSEDVSDTNIILISENYDEYYLWVKYPYDPSDEKYWSIIENSQNSMPSSVELIFGDKNEAYAETSEIMSYHAGLRSGDGYSATITFKNVKKGNYILGVYTGDFTYINNPGISATATFSVTYPSAGTTSKPTSPTTLKATAKSATSIGLTWRSTADSYNIYRSTSKTGTYKKIATSTKAGYTDKGLSKGKTYYYKVTAVSGGKESEYSKIVSAKAVAPAPSTVKAVKTQSGTAKVTWSKTGGTSGYEIYMSSSATNGFKKIKTSGANSAASFTKTGLKTGQTYYFKIRTYTGVNGKKVYSGFSKVVKVTV